MRFALQYADKVRNKRAAWRAFIDWSSWYEYQAHSFDFDAGFDLDIVGADVSFDLLHVEVGKGYLLWRFVVPGMADH
jgi:hypothetical protein